MTQDLREVHQFVQDNNYHGLAVAVQKRTGLSFPTVLKYLKEQPYNPTAVKVLLTAKDLIDEMYNIKP
jgi:hypothetical protein